MCKSQKLKQKESQIFLVEIRQWMILKELKQWLKMVIYKECKQQIDKKNQHDL
jgi:hypothetical protein